MQILLQGSETSIADIVTIETEHKIQNRHPWDQSDDTSEINFIITAERRALRTVDLSFEQGVFRSRSSFLWVFRCLLPLELRQTKPAFRPS